MSHINWDETKFRASSWGNLMTEPRTKAEKEVGILSVTCQKELLKVYAQEKYGRRKEIVTKQMEKGVLAEPDSIELFSKTEGIIFFKNHEKLENEWFTGHPDIFIGDNIQNAEEVWDIKSSWELDSFLPKLIDDIDSGYELQLQCYYSLTGAKSGGIVYCLVDCPESILLEEKYRLLRSMNVVSEESPEYKKASAELEKLLTFPDIPQEERIIKIPIPKNDELIEKMKQKVPRLREFLYDFEKNHLSRNKKY